MNVERHIAFQDVIKIINDVIVYYQKEGYAHRYVNPDFLNDLLVSSPEHCCGKVNQKIQNSIDCILIGLRHKIVDAMNSEKKGPDLK